MKKLLSFKFMFVIFALSISQTFAQNPLISLKFNEGTGEMAASTGTLSTSFVLSTDVPTWSTNVPKMGGSGSIDFGTDAQPYAVESTEIIEGLKGLNAFTITGWLNCKDNTEGPGGNRIVSWINGGGDGVDLVYTSDGSLKLSINEWPDGEKPKSSTDKITTDIDAGPENWKFFAVTYDASTSEVNFYFGDNTTEAILDNKIPYERGAVGMDIQPMAIGHFNIATRYLAPDRMFRGLIDEINVFGEALTADQIVKVQKPLAKPLISLNLNDGKGTSTTNTGSLSATFMLSADVPAWSANVPKGGGPNSIDFGTTTGNYVVESDAVIEGLKSLENFTITGWVNCRNSEEGPGGNRIVQWGNNGGDGVDLVYHNDGSFQMGIDQWSDDGNPPRSSAGKITADPDAKSENWVYFAVTYSASAKEVNYYFGSNAANAVLDKTITYDRGPVGTNIQKLAIGHFNAATRQYALDRMFRGLMDGIKIYGETLTLEQIILNQQDAGSKVVAVTSVSTEESEYDLEVGESVKIKTTVLPSDASNKKVIYSIAPSGIASIDDTGKLLGLAIGTANLTVTTEDGGKTDVAKITVNEQTSVESLITLRFDDGTANTGTLPATFSATVGMPTWSSNVPTTGGSGSVDFGTDAQAYAVESDEIISGLAGLDAFTITGWLNCKDNTEGGGGNRIVSWINGGGDGVDLVYTTVGNLKLSVNEWPDGSKPTSSSNMVTTDAEAGADNWKFFAATYEAFSSEVRFYFGSNTDKAVLDKTITYDRGPVGTNIQKLAIGHFNEATREAAPDRMFRGLMDEINIFSTALTEGQILNVQANKTTSLNKLNLLNINMYPNPVQDKLYLSVFADKITVTTILGKEVLISKGSSVDFSSLKSGIYFVKYFVGQNMGISKIIKQ